MAEANATGGKRIRRIRHTGRGSQVIIYLGKQLRFFINQNDWKVLPMAAIIAGLVGMVIRRRFFVNMEGSLIGAFALTCVAIWNGCFNSIQSVCRERAIIKREHRSGMHITSYVLAHMIYQMLLCAAQTVLTMVVLRLLNVPIPKNGGGMLSKWMIFDLGVTMFLISYAADMMSLFLSSISRTTTGAMTLMPFVLIFQLVFSGGVIPLPEWSRPISNYTISNYGIRALAAQSGYNELPMMSVWNTLSGMRDTEIGGTITVGEIMDKLDSPVVEKQRDKVVLKSFTVGEAAKILADPSMNLRDRTIGDITLGEVLDELQKDEETSGAVINRPVTVGDITDFLKTNEALKGQRDKTVTMKMTVGEMMDIVGEDNVRSFIQDKTAEAAHKPEYEKTMRNIAENWLLLGVFILVFALLSTIALELIDKDKR